MSKFLTLLACFTAVALGACNQRVALVDGPVSPTPLPPAASQPGIASVTIDPGGVLANNGATGIVTLTGPAQPPGLFVSMSSSDDSAIVPATVGIPAGNTFGRFPVTSRWADGDRVALITASTPQSTVTMPFEVWLPDAPAHLLYFSNDGDPVGLGGFGRFTPPTSAFSATCNRNQVRISITPPGRDQWSLTFKAPGNGPLKLNFYEAARIGFDESWAGMDIVAGGRSCGAIEGYFSIDEIDLSSNRVNVLRGEFRQECHDHGGQLQGQFRFELARGTSSGSNCLR